MHTVTYLNDSSHYAGIKRWRAVSDSGLDKYKLMSQLSENYFSVNTAGVKTVANCNM